MNFLNVARGSAAELSYLIHLARELGYLAGDAFTDRNDTAERVIRQLEALLQKMEAIASSERPH